MIVHVKKGALTGYLLLGGLKLFVVRDSYLTCSENSINISFIRSVSWPQTLFHKHHVSNGGGLIGFHPKGG